MRIIGLAGTFASGKDTLAGMLEGWGFVHVSTSDIVRKFSSKEYGNTDRQSLVRAGNQLRAENSGDFLARTAFEQAKAVFVENDNIGVVISGLRSVAEAKYLHSIGAELVFVDAPIELRYQRAVKRSRDVEVKSFESFRDAEVLESQNTDVNTQNIQAIKKISDVIIINDDDLQAFENNARISLNLAQA